MELPLFIKIKLFITLGISVVVFATVGWSIGQPENPGDAVTIALDHSPVTAFLWLILLSLTVTFASLAVSGRHRIHIAPLAVPAGLITWSLMSNGFDALLLKNYVPADRSAMFYGLITDTILWFAVVMSGYGLTVFASRALALKKEENQLREHEMPPKDIKPPAPKPAKTNLMDAEWVRNILSVALTCLIALILLKIFVRSGQANSIVDNQKLATTAAAGQIVFAVVTAFLLGTLASRMLLGGAIWCFFFAPLIIAVINYINAANVSSQPMLGEVSSHFIPSDISSAAILPVQYIGLGSLAVIWGYWLSIQIHLGRVHHQRSKHE